MIKIKEIDHIAIAVKSIDGFARLFESGLGIKLDGQEDIPDRHLRIGFIDLHNTKVELVEPTADDSAISRFLAGRGEGIHHICIRVENIEQAIAHLIDNGFEMIDKVPRTGASGSKVAFVHPRSFGGVLIELKEIKD